MTLSKNPGNPHGSPGFFFAQIMEIGSRGSAEQPDHPAPAKQYGIQLPGDRAKEKTQGVPTFSDEEESLTLLSSLMKRAKRVAVSLTWENALGIS